MKESFKITILADSYRRCEEIGEILRKHYDVVINTGINENTRPPNMGKWRGYFTVVLEEDNEDE